MDIFERITNLLKEKSITRMKLCEDTGISYLTLSTIYKRRSEMSGRMIKTIADYLDTTADYLITGNEKYKEKSSVATSVGQSLLIHKENQVTAIARGGDKVQYDLTDAEMQAIITLLDSMKKDKQK